LSPDEVPDEAGGFEVSEDEKEFLGRKEWAICVATFYDDLAERLIAGAMEGFAEGGVTMASVQTYEVPGAFELPFAAKVCAGAGVFAGVACLGGEREIARGIIPNRLDTLRRL